MSTPVANKDDTKSDFDEFYEEVDLADKDLSGKDFPIKAIKAIKALFGETGRKLGAILQEAEREGTKVDHKRARGTARRLVELKDKACQIVLRPLTSRKTKTALS
jgi:hypothetical protein